MSGAEELFTAALGLSAPWRVEDVRFSASDGEIHFDVGCGVSRLSCPVCGQADQRIHDRKDKTWQHLHFFQYKAFIHARVPRVACGGCGKTTQVEVPWARQGSGFTLLFEALAITLAQQMAVKQVAELLDVEPMRLWRMIERVVGVARTAQSHEDVRRIGVDEKHAGRLGFVSVFHDATQRRVLFATPGRKGESFEAFADDLSEHGGEPERIEAVAMDFSKAYQSGCAKHLPQAEMCFDAFHLIKLANEALDQVRRQEVKEEDDLKGIRWATLKDSSDWKYEQICDMHWLKRSGLKTARAWQLKERLRDILADARAGADPSAALKGWVSWARRSRLEPFKRLGATVRDHMEGILNSYRFGMSNGTAESINSRIQVAISRARGFRTLKNLFAIIYLTAGKLTHLPRSPFIPPQPA